MTNQDKRELRQMCRDGWSFDDIKDIVICCDATIKRYMKALSLKKEQPMETEDDCPKKRKPESCSMCKWYDYYDRTCHFERK